MMNKPPQNNPARARLRELLDIPDRDRTEEEWDELNELEISLAQGNRQGAPQQHGQRDNRPQMQPGQKPKGQGQGQGLGQGQGPSLSKPNKRFNRKHKKR
jgi:hypothetical protein